MWTNVFIIGGLHNLSWFQFLPSESELPSPDRRRKTFSAHGQILLLDPGIHLKVYATLMKRSSFGTLSLGGMHLLLKMLSSISKLRVVASGFWVAPGDSEEVSVALSQALRNCIERAILGLSYMRFGDVFSKFSPSQSKKYVRRGQPTVEFVFATTEETIFVHAIITAKERSDTFKWRF